MTTATTTATKISVSHLYKRYGSHQVIDDVSFDVQEGQVTLLAGPNGAGKSTLLRMICGLDTIDKGDITIMGRHYSQLSDPKHTIGALLDATWLDTALTAEQNLRVLADLAGIHRRRVANCLEMCGLTSVAGRANAAALPLPCWGTRSYSSWMSRSTAWTRPACAGSMTCWNPTLRPGGPRCFPAIFLPTPN